MKISVSKSAFNDLKNIISYYQSQGAPDVGIKFANAIITHIELLTEHPDIGRVVPEFEQAHIREIIHKPFRIVYERGTYTVKVIRVWRSERLLILPTKVETGR